MQLTVSSLAYSDPYCWEAELSDQEERHCFNPLTSHELWELSLLHTRLRLKTALLEEEF